MFRKGKNQEITKTEQERQESEICSYMRGKSGIANIPTILDKSVPTILDIKDHDNICHYPHEE